MTVVQAIGQIAQNPGEEQSEGEIAPGIFVILFSQEKEDHRDQGNAREHDKKHVVVFERTKSRAGVGNIYQIEPARNDIDLGFGIDVMQNPILGDLIERIERQRKERDPLHIMPKRTTSLGMTASFCGNHGLATVAQIGMDGTLADSFAMAPATRTFCVRRFLDNGGRLVRVFDNEIA
jgi:hypothetical protein